MTEDLKTSIESFLLDRAPDEWTPLAVLVERFQLSDDRDLRADGKNPGPLSFCTIFSGHGVKHIKHSTLKERIKCRNRIRRELISRARRLRWFNTAIAHCLDSKSNPPSELHTGQTLLFP